MFILRAHPGLDFSPQLIHAACNNLANDPQSEGSRAAYIFNLISRSKQKDRIVSKVLQKLKGKKDDFWALSQLCDLALLFHRNGVAAAREVFLQRFDNNLLAGYEFCGDEQILALEGLPGLRHLLAVCGKLHASGRETPSGWYIDEFAQKNKSLDVRGELARAGAANAQIQAWLDSLIPYESAPRRRKSRNVSAYTLETVQSRIHNVSRYCNFSAKLAEHMAPALVETLAREFLVEIDKIKQAKYLKFFSVKKFPFDYAPLLKIARKKIIGKSRLVPNAVGALAHFSGADIRQLALEKLALDDKPDEYMLLLMSSLQSDDMPLLMRLIYRRDDFDYIHGLISDLLKLSQAHPQVDCTPALLAMYARMNCGLHRRQLLALLHERHALPDDIIWELAFDSYDEVRALYRKIKRERKN